MTLKGAWKAIGNATKALSEEKVPLLEALGRVSSRPVAAPLSLPASAVSGLDGYAVKGEGTEFRVKGVLGPFASNPAPLKKGEAVFVSTGAPIPPGTRFVRREKIATEGEAFITVESEGDDRKLWPRGSWMKKGRRIVNQGDVIGPTGIESLALARKKEIGVFRRPSVVLLTTGDELAKGRIPDSNRYLLASLCMRDGALIGGFDTAGDSGAQIREKIETLGARGELLLITGGTSKGRKDLTYPALEDLKSEFLVRRPPFNPGGTLAFGRMGRLLFFVLPGNPKALVTLYELFVKSCLLRFSGRPDWRPRATRVVLEQGLEGRGEKTLFIPVKVSSGEGRIKELYSDEPDAIAVVDGGRKWAHAGQKVEVVWHRKVYL
jgi:molybdopterin molybdotransferase